MTLFDSPDSQYFFFYLKAPKYLILHFIEFYCIFLVNLRRPKTFASK
jgi:hypothetical protein